MDINKTTLNKLLLARRLYLLAREMSKTSNGLRLAIACNLLQDAIESFLLAISEHTNSGIGQRTDFDKYFDLVNEKIAPKELPFRQRLIALNRLRINAKHYGLEPAKAEMEPLVQTAAEFFSEVTQSLLNRTFATLSLADLLTDSDQSELIKTAESCFETHDFAECLIECRKALYVAFEWKYDAREFHKASQKMVGLASFASGVPYFARDKDYLDENVGSPTDYVIYDHSEHDISLMKAGIDSVSYWNVWRLTPAVYRVDKDSEWVVKREFRKVDEDGIRERAEYVLASTTEILLTKQEHSSRSRSPDHRRFYLTLKRECVPVYKKASLTSELIQTTPAGMRKLDCDYLTQALDDSSNFWHVAHWEKDLSIYGYVHEGEVDS